MSPTSQYAHIDQLRQQLHQGLGQNNGGQQGQGTWNSKGQRQHNQGITSRTAKGHGPSQGNSQARLSSFPLAFNGNSSSSTIADGTPDEVAEEEAQAQTGPVAEEVADLELDN